MCCSQAEKLPEPTGIVQRVLDGGPLLRRIPWTRGATFNHVFSNSHIMRSGN